MDKETILQRVEEGTVYLEPEYCFEAVVGKTHDGRLVYSYDKLIEVMMREEKLSYEEAAEWIDYNTVRSLPYMGDMRPELLYEI